jgi:hypothetical protein
MKALERYLLDCENKRRRSRDRPSNEVLTELRLVLAQVEDARALEKLASPAERADAEDLGEESLGSISTSP